MSKSNCGVVLVVCVVVGELKKVLIVNINSGGYVVIGFWIVKDLVDVGYSVMILIVGEELFDKMKK